MPPATIAAQSPRYTHVFARCRWLRPFGRVPRTMHFPALLSALGRPRSRANEDVEGTGTHSPASLDAWHNPDAHLGHSLEKPAPALGSNNPYASRRLSATGAPSSARPSSPPVPSAVLDFGEPIPRRPTGDSLLANHRIGRTVTELLTPDRPVNPSPGHWESVKHVFCFSWLNILLICIPISWALHFVFEDQDKGLPNTDKTKKNHGIVVFVISFLAIMPLAQLLSFGTEEIALRVGDTLGGLLNATLGNAVELITAIIALFQCQLGIVQTSLVGSVLSNLLLVLGMCFFAGGVKYKEQRFHPTAAQLNSSLLVMATLAVLTPAGYHALLGPNIPDPSERPYVLQFSRGVSVILLTVYIAYLFFTLSSHKYLFEPGVAPPHETDSALVGSDVSRKVDPHGTVGSSHDATKTPLASAMQSHEADDDEETPQVSGWVAFGTLCISTALVGVTCEWLVDSIDAVAASGASRTWIGLIILPIVSNATEHVTAVTVAVKNKLDLSMGVAVGSSIQISIFVIPLCVVIAWCGDKPLSLLFDPFVSIFLFLSVLIVNSAISDGRANWLAGYILMCCWVIAAVVFWYVPDNTDNYGLFPDSGPDSVCRY